MGNSMVNILDHCTDAPIERYEPGAVLIDEGRWSGHLFVLVEGEVEVLRGGTTVATVSDPGAVFGEMSVLLDLPHTATVRARTRVTVRAPDDATLFLRQHPEIAFHLARLLAQRLNAATTYLVDVKRQYEGHGDHLGMLGEVLEALTVQQGREFTREPDRTDDPRM
ncbi:MAG: family transcriptional regulator, cyclic receptor protein [Candidatus Hydrogenedentes bacterium]|nr:family transcriptional regulator, cyclic receptor protein [Candidatus Hydrogenedentota bacterium]